MWLNVNWKLIFKKMAPRGYCIYQPQFGHVSSALTVIILRHTYIFVYVGQVGSFQTMQPGSKHSHGRYDVSDGAKTPSHESNWPLQAISPYPVCGVAMELSPNALRSKAKECLSPPGLFVKTTFYITSSITVHSKSLRDVFDFHCNIRVGGSRCTSRRVKCVYLWVWELFTAEWSKYTLISE